jgi:hypothetical protein
VLLGHVPVGNVEDVWEDVPVPRAHRGLQDTSHEKQRLFSHFPISNLCPIDFSHSDSDGSDYRKFNVAVQ